MTVYVIGQRSPPGATSESEITHYKVAMSKKTAESNIGVIVKRENLIQMIRPQDELIAYDVRNNHTWKLGIADI